MTRKAISEDSIYTLKLVRRGHVVPEGLQAAVHAAQRVQDVMTTQFRWVGQKEPVTPYEVRFHIIRNARIENVGKSQSCMVSNLRMIWKQGLTLVLDDATVTAAAEGGGAANSAGAFAYNP